jgi:hypothetical protein
MNTERLWVGATKMASRSLGGFPATNNTFSGIDDEGRTSWAGSSGWSSISSGIHKPLGRWINLCGRKICLPLSLENIDPRL